MFRQLDIVADRQVTVGGQDYLFFGGTAYLGLNTYLPFVDLFKKGVDLFGVNNGNSRSNNVQLAIYPEAEAIAADRFGMADAIVVSSGFLAAQLAVRYLAQQYDEICYAPNTHPALWLDGEPETANEDFVQWQSRLVERINTSGKTHFLIISNTLESLVPKRHDFRRFQQIRKDKHIHFLLDDSHGIGLQDGNTYWKEVYPVPESVHTRLTVVASMAKGLGLDAGLILSDKNTIAGLRSSAAYRGASPPPPAAMYAFIHGTSIYAERRAKLRDNMTQFVKEINGMNFQYMDGFPVFHSPDQTLYERLHSSRIVISSFRYPSLRDSLYNRIVISAAHNPEDIRHLLHALR